MFSTMECQKAQFFVTILVILFGVSSSKNVCNPACKAKESFNCDDPLTFNRTNFPKNFTFGAATSAYQKVPDRSSGDLACDSFDLYKVRGDLYKEDVKLLKRMKVQAYRLSIAWSRILPSIEPYVTIFHWDVPQTLEDEYGGFLSRRIVEDYKNYAELLFQRFGDRVKFWITLNQPYSLASKGYGDGSYPPGRCTGCEFGGNSGTEPYIVAHNQLLAHAKTVALYGKRYQVFGSIGLWKISKDNALLSLSHKSATPTPNPPNLFPNHAPSYVYYPPGFRQILNYIKNKYGNPLTCITENGTYITENGYFSWSLMDNYEFGNGYTLRFGMNWVNFTNPSDRREKDSGKWFSKFIIKQ
ncbi:hypothetical protein DY000_02048520 [Brassica cretica]|uniref:thioglucosidase n=1 Tax=Brassica cretica TaxID=69181 RepID=A0ABQ7F9N3_BRACR|nr:hypothetical protein DY000_02048520 [Brassica cretica]